MESRFRLGPEEREQLRVRARTARERTRELIASSAVVCGAAIEQLDESQLHVAITQRTRDDLRASVGEYASFLRHLETPPEQAVIEIKSMVSDAVVSNPRAATLMMSMIVAWAIDAYYAA